jgi:broad specificity phosphatase PhoE
MSFPTGAKLMIAQAPLADLAQAVSDIDPERNGPSSFALRARQTAGILGLGRAVRVDCGLCELNTGEGDGLSVEEFSRHYITFDWTAEPDRPVAPGGRAGISSPHACRARWTVSPSITPGRRSLP